MERGKWREAGYPVYWRRHLNTLTPGRRIPDQIQHESGGYHRTEASASRHREDPSTGEKKLVLTLAGKNGLSPDQQKQILNTLNEGKDNQFQTSETYAVEPYIGAKALKNSIIAIILSFLFIIVYIRLRFSSLGGLAAGVTAVLALMHDICIVLFVFGIFRIPLNDAFVAVTLTIIGYSINDTIVLYDRIREHRNTMKRKGTLAELVDLSTTETLGRSINTAFTVTLCAFIILAASIVYQMESITKFSLPLLAGLVSGCYSSICIAAPLWVWWEEQVQKTEDRDEKEMKNIKLFLEISRRGGSLHRDSRL